MWQMWGSWLKCRSEGREASGQLFSDLHSSPVTAEKCGWCEVAAAAGHSSGHVSVALR